MKKIVIINSSIRRKNTYNLLQRLGKMLKAYDTEFIEIRDYKIKPCTGCENCLKNGRCLIGDDADMLLKKIEEADGIIIGTPVYLRQITGSLKLLIDRTCAWYHRPPLAGKPIFFATTTQASGAAQTAGYLKDLSRQWGTIYTGNVSRTMFNLDRELPNKALSKFVFFLEPHNRRKFRPGFKDVIEFNTQKLLAAHVLPLDREYWAEKSYLSSPYYYACRLGPVKRLTGFIYFRIGSFFMKRGAG